jgi:hypothetical protein
VTKYSLYYFFVSLVVFALCISFFSLLLCKKTLFVSFLGDLFDLLFSFSIAFFSLSSRNFLSIDREPQTQDMSFVEAFTGGMVREKARTKEGESFCSR